MKKTIDVYEHMGEILKGVKSGVLITGKADDKVNSMTISWGMVGIEWGKPIFVTFIRENRFTLKRLANLQSAFRLMTVRKKSSASAVPNQEETLIKQEKLV